MHRLLFLAPFDFDPRVREDYEQAFDMNSTGQPEIIVANPNAPFVYDDNTLRMYPMLKVLATPSTGTNHIDFEACAKRGVKIISLLDDREKLNKISASAEFTFKLLLDALRLPPPRELQGKVIGIIGYGRIGHRISDYVFAFDAEVRIYDPYQYYKSNLGDMFKYCDAVVVSCTYNAETRGLVIGRLMRSMKAGAALINTSRGEVIDEDELVKVMKERPDLRVAVDVLVGETTGTQRPERLAELGAIVTPHIAGATYDSRTKAAKIILDLLRKEYGYE